jgi:predicted N-acetyltransferase YhbS
VIALGHPGYSRLGFVPAENLGISPPEGADIPSDAWMAMRLTQYDADMRGTASYASDFIETGSIPGL